MRPRRGLVTSHLLIDNFVPFASAVVRRSLLDRFGAFDQRLDMGIDYELWLRLSVQCEFDYVPDVVGQYRVWSGQMSRKVFDRYDAGIEIMRRFLRQNAGEVSSRDAHRGWAHTYVGRGDQKLWVANSLPRAWADYMVAVRHDVTYWPIYRAMLRSFLLRRAPRL
jgi:hypothetical protein